MPPNYREQFSIMQLLIEIFNDTYNFICIQNAPINKKKREFSRMGFLELTREQRKILIIRGY